MTRGDLIFDWRSKDSHTGRKLAAFAVVALVFGFFLSLFKVRFEAPATVSVKNASVLFFPDEGVGRVWRLKAEEEGPFPGRLEIGGGNLADLDDIRGWDGGEGWNDHTVEMRPMRSSVGESVDRIASKGTRYFPERESAQEGVGPAPPAVGVGDPFPVLIPYSKEALGWLPETLPPFQRPSGDVELSSSWRFVLNLRANGTVEQCFSLSGGDDPALVAMIDWLEGLRFAPSGDESRWMGLRVEFLNERSDGTDSE